MSRIRLDQFLLPSVLDRLLDNEPDNQKETLREQGQLLSDLKKSVRRDLENLLNTRVPFPELPADLPRLRKSVVNYGVPDFSRATLESKASMEKLRRSIEEAIRLFETRFSRVSVEIENDANARFSRTIKFRIEGELYAQPAPEPVAYSSQLNAVAKEFRVQDSMI